MFHADLQTVGQIDTTKLNRFSQFCDRAKEPVVVEMSYINT